MTAATCKENVFADPVVSQPIDSDEVVSRCRATSEGELYEFTWTRPSNSPGIDRLQKIEISILRAGERTEFALRSVLEPESFRVAPVDVSVVQRPRIIDRITKRFECRVGVTPVLSYPQVLGADTVEPFIRSTLTNQDRTLPAVLVSYEPGTRKPVRDPDWIQDRLLGLANVFEITPDGSDVLSERVGRARSCVGGRIRLYWPGFTRRAVPRSHPYFTPEYIRGRQEEGGSFEHVLLERITHAAADRYSSSSALRDFQKHLRAVRREELIQPADADSDAWFADYESVLNENDRLHKRVEGLERRLAMAQKNIQAMGITAGRVSAPDSSTESESHDNIDSPSEALEFAEGQFGRYIYVWKSAWKSAEKAHHHDAPQIVEALKAIAKLADKYNRLDGAVGPWKAHFDRWGFKFASQESGSTMNQHGDKRQFHDGAEEATMESHVTLGQGHEHCLQIYFDRSENDPRFQIGYCGEHLPFASDNT